MMRCKSNYTLEYAQGDEHLRIKNLPLNVEKGALQDRSFGIACIQLDWVQTQGRIAV